MGFGRFVIHMNGTKTETSEKNREGETAKREKKEEKKVNKRKKGRRNYQTGWETWLRVGGFSWSSFNLCRASLEQVLVSR